jgi:hypothetical protein
MKTILFIVFVLGVTIDTMAQPNEEKQVATRVEMLRMAMIDGDRSQLESLTSKDLSYGHSSGMIEDQKSFIESLATGKSDFVRIDLSDQTIQIVGKTVALVRHKLNADTRDGGVEKTISLGILLVWQKEKGEWKLLARQAYKL